MAATYPADTFQEGVDLTIEASNQLAQVVRGDANTEVTVADGSTIPSIRKAQTDSMYFKEPEAWTTGQTETDYLQLKKYINTVTSKESWWFAKSAMVSNPVAMGTSPFGDDNWTLYTPEDLFISGKAEYESVYQALKGKAAEAGYNLVRGSFEEGGTLTGTSDVLWYQTTGKYYNWFNGSAKTVVAGSTPAGTGGIGVGAWVDRTDVTLRDKLALDNGAGMVGTSDGRTVQERFDNIPAEVDAAGTAAALISQHNSSPAAHPELSAFISAEANRAEAAAESVKPYVDRALSDLSTAANKFYPTLAEANADIANIDVNQPVTVGEAVNGGLWYKATAGATSLTKSAHDPVGTANNYTDDKTKFVSGYRSVNIADLTTAQSGRYISYLNGGVYVNPEYLATDYLEVEGGVEYRTDVRFNHQFAFYDENKVFISGLLKPDAAKKFTTPSNAKYIRMSVYDAPYYTDEFMVAKSSEYPDTYTPYFINLRALNIATNQVNNLFKEVRDDLGVKTVNIIDATKVVSDSYVDYRNGNIGSVSGYFATRPIEIKPNTEYQTSSFYDNQFAFYNSDGVYISGMVVNTSRKFVSPATAKYIRLTIRNSQLDTLVVSESSIFPDYYVPYGVKTIEDFTLTKEQVTTITPYIEESLGFEVANIIDKDNVVAGKYVVYSTGNLADNPSFSASYFLGVKSNTEYQVSSFYNQQLAFYDENLAYISGLIYPNSDKRFTTPVNAKYLRISIPNSQLDTLVVTESILFPSGYIGHDVKTTYKLIIPGVDVRTTQIWVSADESDTDSKVKFKGKNAIQLALDSITDATAKNRYRIIAKGVFKVDKAVDYIGYRGYPSMILAKDFVEIIGDGNTVVSAELPYDDADIGLSVDGGNYQRIQYQTLYTYAENALIKGIKFIAKNIRYATHIDNPNGANKRHDFKDVSFIFKGDKGSRQALGVGTSSGEETYFEGGECHSDVGTPFYCHNNSKFLKPSLMSFKDYSFSSNVNKSSLNLQNCGSLVKDKVELIGCSFGGSAYAIYYGGTWLKNDTAGKYDSFDHAEWIFSGYGNDPFLFENNADGLSLRFKTTGVGTDKTIRFDKTASAYSQLIQNNQANTGVSLYLDNRDYIDGYIVQDGSVGLPAQALGCKDVSEVAGLYDSGVIYTSLGKRLGDCSVVNKVLKVIINGATNTITFNKDYTAMTNSVILAEINAALTGATADLYSYGRDYYPMMSDVAETVYNSGAAYIPKGSVVTKSGGTVRPANGNDKVFGVALDDIPVMQITSDGARKGCGRVLKRGYIYANSTKAHFVLADNQNPAVGTCFSVSNGQLVTDVSGKISVDIDTGVVSINC